MDYTDFTERGWLPWREGPYYTSGRSACGGHQYGTGEGLQGFHADGAERERARIARATPNRSLERSEEQL